MLAVSVIHTTELPSRCRVRMRQVSVHEEQGRRLLRYPCAKKPDEGMRRRTMPCPYCAAPATTEITRRTMRGDRMVHCRACRRTCNVTTMNSSRYDAKYQRPHHAGCWPAQGHSTMDVHAPLCIKIQCHALCVDGSPAEACANAPRSRRAHSSRSHVIIQDHDGAVRGGVARLLSRLLVG